MAWRETTEPYKTAWHEILEHAKRGLIHGMEAHDIIDRAKRAVWGTGSQCTADTAMFLREMVEAGALRPVKKDLAGASHSVRSFRGLQNLRESNPPEHPDVQWWLNDIPCEAADAHLWTFELTGQ